MRYLVRLKEKPDLRGPADEAVGQMRAAQGRSQNRMMNKIADSNRSVEVKNRFWISNSMVIETDDPSALTQLQNDPDVDSVIEEPYITIDEVEADFDPIIPNQTYTYGLVNIQAPEAWQLLGNQGSGVKVCTLDTGVQASHFSLQGKLTNFAEFNANGSIISTTPRDSHYHGTHVAGTIHGGAHYGNQQQFGVAPGSQMAHALVLPEGGGTFAQIAGGIQWAINIGSHIMNLSLGGSSGAYWPEIGNARAAGVLACISSGNDGPGITGAPGNNYTSLSVGAYNSANTIANFSGGAIRNRLNYQPQPPSSWPTEWRVPRVSAPGVSVMSSIPDNSYANLSGTSMAAPHVAGAAALVRAAGVSGPDNIERLLMDTSTWDDRFLRHPDIDTRTGEGRINVYRAVQRALS